MSDGISSVYRYVVLREKEGGRWGAGLGWGDRYEDLVGSWPSERMALRAACEAWRRRVARDAVDRAPAMPLVLRLGPGENASQAAQSGRDVRPAPWSIWSERLMVGTNGDERRAMRDLRAGRAGGISRSHVEMLIARARAEGAPLHDEAELLELLEQSRRRG